MLPNRKHQYYSGDTTTFRGSFKVDGVAQTPDADTCKATIVKVVDGGTDTVIVSDATGTISGTQLQYQYASMPTGEYAIFITAEYNTGQDKRTGVIEFVVLDKEGT